MTQAVLENHQSAPIDNGLKALFSLLQKLCLTPAEVSGPDVAACTQEGLSKEAVDEAVQVCAIFCIIVRIADALDFDVPPQEVFKKGAPMMLKRGYVI